MGLFWGFDEGPLTPKLLGWMLKGLEGAEVHTLALEEIEPFAVAFSIQFQKCLGADGEIPDVMEEDRLKQIIQTARDQARPLVDPFKSKRLRANASAERDGIRLIQRPAKKVRFSLELS